jgi:hypothetical protein
MEVTEKTVDLNTAMRVKVITIESSIWAFGLIIIQLCLTSTILVSGKSIINNNNVLL